MAASKSTFTRSNLSDVIDQALDENGAVIIKRPGRKDLLILPADRFREFDTASYLLASSRNRTRLLAALRDARAGKGRPMTVKSLRAKVGLTG